MALIIVTEYIPYKYIINAAKLARRSYCKVILHIISEHTLGRTHPKAASIASIYKVIGILQNI